MAVSKSFKIQGARELEKVLGQLPKAVRGAVLDKAVRAGGNVLKKEIALRAPDSGEAGRPRGKKNFGKLKQNIKVSKLKDTRDSAGVVIHTGKAYWGFWQEFGTSRQAPRPFMRPAIDAKAGEAIQKQGDVLGKNIEKVARELAGKFRSISKATRRRL